MISALLRNYAASAPEHEFLIDARGSMSARGAVQSLPGLVEALKELGGSRICFYARDSARLVLALIAAEAAGLESCIVNRQSPANEVSAILERLGASVLIADDADSVPDARPLSISALFSHAVTLAATQSLDTAEQPGTIVILTTGTTGPPKAARYTWERLLGRIPSRDSAQGRTWLLAYPLNHFAGIQVLLAVLRDRCALVIPEARDFHTVIETMIRYNVDSVSATPTFWRMLSGRLTEQQVKQLHLTQITIGGEASTAELLERLKSRFPAAAITQVYATTEAGTCFAVKDGLPGFPASFLDRRVGNVELKIIDGELYIRSSAGMLSYIDGIASPPAHDDWVATGDLVERTTDRVLFRGRKSEIINVGGVKVHPLKVEETMLRVPGVSAVRAYGASSPVTGQIVACDLELEDGADETTVLQTAQRTCLSTLSRYEQPRRMKVVDRL